MRRRYLKGKLEDSNKYFKCDYCGAINRVDRNKHSDRSNISYSEYVVVVDKDKKTPLTMDVFGDIGGVNSGIYRRMVSTIGSGCWFCGSTNI